MLLLEKYNFLLKTRPMLTKSITGGIHSVLNYTRCDIHHLGYPCSENACLRTLFLSSKIF